MKPIRLELYEFGPYKSEVVEWNKIINEPMFLITGKTGSGKSTLFDAITYALYNKTTGGKDISTLRTKTANDNEKTRVVFDFELKGKHYKIDRTLAYLKSGNKNITSGKVALIEIVDGDEVVIATKEQDVREKVEELIGLDDKQFCQIIILPQGKFKEFLLSKSSEKKETLRSLFNTYFYQKFSDKLQEHSKALGTNYKNKENKLVAKFEQFTFYDELSKFEFLKEENLAEVSNFLENEGRLLNEEKNKLDLLIAEENTLNEKYRKLEKIGDKFKSLEENKKSYEELEKSSVEIAEVRKIIEELEELEKNKEKIDEYERIKSRKIRNIEIKNNIEENKKLVSNKKVINYENMMELLKIEEEVEKNREEIEKYRYFYNEIAIFKRAYEDIKEFNSRLDELVVYKERLENNEEQLVQLIEDLTELEEEKVIIDNSTGKITLDIMKKENEVEKLLQYRENLSNIEKEKKELISKKDELLVLVKDKESLEKKVKQYKKKEEQEFLNSIIEHLHEGDNCPLCNQKITTLPKIQKIEKSEYNDEVEKLNNISEEIIRLEVIISKQEEDLEKKEIDLEKSKGSINFEAASQLSSIKEEQTSLKKELKNLNSDIIKVKSTKENVEKEIKKLNEQLKLETELREKLLLATQTTNQYSENVKISINEFENYYKKIKSEVDNFDTMKKKYEDEKVELEMEDKELEVELKNNSLNLKELELDLENILKKYNSSKIKDFYETIENARENLPKLIKLLDYKKRVEEYERTVSLIKETIKILKNELKEKERPDLESVNKELELKKDEVGSFKEKVVIATEELKNNKKLYEDINKEFLKLQDDIKLSREIVLLSDVVNGKTQSKKSLETYVQSYYLDLILEAASKRLLQMSEDRYSFSRKIEKSKGGGLQGLDIEIYDIYMNATRDISSLSGGELFLSSLSLALGLAEVIQNQSGGISLETIFIDEGFGSLDAQTLDIAISTLIDLQSYGRNIGIISHVSELQERIRPKIEVFSKNNYAKVKILGI